jgi:hypothetical protein
MFNSPILKLEGHSQVPAMQGFPHGAQHTVGGITSDTQLFSGSDFCRRMAAIQMAFHQLRRSFYQNKQLAGVNAAGIGSQHFLQIGGYPDALGHDTPYSLKDENGIARRGTHLREQSGARSIPESVATKRRIGGAVEPLSHQPENGWPAGQASIEKADDPYGMHGYIVMPSS